MLVIMPVPVFSAILANADSFLYDSSSLTFRVNEVPVRALNKKSTSDNELAVITPDESNCNVCANSSFTIKLATP